MRWFYWLIDLVEPTPPVFERLAYYEPPGMWAKGLALLVALCVFVIALEALLTYSPNGEVIRSVLADVRKK